MKKQAMLLAAALVALASGCGDDDSAGGGGDADTVAVYAPETAEPVVTALIDAFEAENQGIDAEFSARSQADLVAALSENSGADVVIAPDPWLTDVDADLETTPFGRNLAVIVVPPGNPAGVTDLTAFAADSGLRVLACGPNSEIGNFAAVLLARAGVTPAEEAVGVRCGAEAAQAVAAGELDAAFMFRDELGTRGDVEVVQVPDDQNLVVTMSSIVVEDRTQSNAFAEFLASPTSEQIRTEHGYLP